MDSFVEDCVAVLSRTPIVLDALLRGLPEEWLSADEGPGTWNPHIVVGHLIHGERTDWMPRMEMILTHGKARPFDPFVHDPATVAGRTMGSLLDEFAAIRREKLDQLRALALGPGELALEGMHPALGVVTARQLLATWTSHDLAHILQISRVMAKRLKPEVGPWADYLSVMK